MRPLINDVRACSIWDQPRLDILGKARKLQQEKPLHVDWLNYHGALYACRNWHYSGSMPASKTVKIGIWEHGRFTGCMVYSRGANPKIGQPFQLPQTGICELTRIALKRHQTPVSRLISLSLKLLRKQSPNLRMIVSYADTEQGHIGTVYQASNWRYLGEIDSYKIRFGDEILHPRTMNERAKRTGQSLREYINASAQKIENVRGLTRHKYIWPLDDEMKELAVKLSIPYPQR